MKFNNYDVAVTYQVTAILNISGVERYSFCHSGEIRMGSMSRHQASLK
jgi:hypothetical protein